MFRQLIIGNNNSFSAGYVKQGLVSWFDGFANTGSGHSATTTRWQDLANNSRYIDVSNSLGDYLKWGSDGLWVKTTGVVPATKSNTGTLRDDTSYTFEIVLSGDTDKGEPTDGTIASLSNATASGRYGLSYIRVYRYDEKLALRFDANHSDDETQYTGVIYLSNNDNVKTLTLTVTYNAGANTGVVSFFENGVFKKRESLDNVRLYIGGQPIRLFNWVSASTATYGSAIYCMRVYDRALSESEISTNAGIDEERFGEE